MIERYNVLELLGADKNKYHSCIITCFSFDFLFFEQRVLPKLRHAGIMNINLFVDARMFQQQLDALDGNYRNNKSYSITPIELNGAFHPKIIMAFGKNNGFLAIGSGNLTNSGLSSNDEVWGAFHTYKTTSEATPLFKSVFQYLNPLEKYCYGVNKTKWNWILKNTGWLKDILNDPNQKSVLKTKNESIQLFASFADASIYKQLIDSLPNEPLESLIIISPYFNKNGKVIEQFIGDLNPSKVKVVIDKRFGTVPYKYNNTNNVQFYDWQLVNGIPTHERPRLHAKIIQFNFKTKTYILLGSANATVEALGTITSHTKNAEMSILVGIEENKNWLEEMKIELPAKGNFNMEGYELPITDDFISGNNNLIFKIKHAELDFTTLKIFGFYFENILDNYSLIIVKRNDLFHKQPLTGVEFEGCFTMELTEEGIDGACKVYIEDVNGIKQSNVAFLHFSQDINKTNPDEKSLRFLELINSDVLPDNDLVELLEYARFENEKPAYDRSENPLLVLKKEDLDTDKVYDIVDEEEFNKNEEIIDANFSYYSNHLTLLEEFLDHMTFGYSSIENFSDSDERTIEGARDSGVDDKDLNKEIREQLPYQKAQEIKNKLHNTLNKINVAIDLKHGMKLEQALDNYEFENKEVLNDLKSVLIGLHLIIMKINHTFKEEKVQFIVKFKNPDDLILFEKEKGYNISRVSTKINVANNEMQYSADVNILSKVNDIIMRHENIELIYIDETPSILKDHKYFESNPILKYQNLYFDTIKGYLINTVSPLIFLLLNTVDSISSDERVRYNIYKKRLFYRVALIFKSVVWTYSEQSTCELFLLNLFRGLLPENIEIDEVNKQLSDIKLKLNEHIDESDKSSIIFQKHLESYLNWKKIFNNDKSKLIVTLDRSYVHRIIYKNKFGFCRITTIYTNDLNVETPLGYFNDDNESYQIKGITSGKKALIYN